MCVCVCVCFTLHGIMVGKIDDYIINCESRYHCLLHTFGFVLQLV